MKRFVSAVAISALALGGSACATKKMVKQRVGEVNDKVDTLSKSVEENQERTRANEVRIGEVDQKAQAANTRAEQAGQRAEEAYGAADKVNARADAIEKFLSGVGGSVESLYFAFGGDDVYVIVDAPSH